MSIGQYASPWQSHRSMVASLKDGPNIPQRLHQGTNMGSMYRIFPALIVLYRDITVAREVTQSTQTQKYLSEVVWFWFS